MKKLRTKVQAGDNVFFRGMEGEVMSFLSKDLVAKTFGVDFYSDNIYLEFKVTKNGYKIITSNSGKWLINKTYKPKEFTVLFRPGTGQEKINRKKQIKSLIQKLYSSDNKDKRYADCLFAIRLLEKV